MAHRGPQSLAVVQEWLLSGVEDRIVGLLYIMEALYDDANRKRFPRRRPPKTIIIDEQDTADEVMNTLMAFVPGEPAEEFAHAWALAWGLTAFDLAPTRKEVSFQYLSDCWFSQDSSEGLMLATSWSLRALCPWRSLNVGSLDDERISRVLERQGYRGPRAYDVVRMAFALDSMYGITPRDELLEALERLPDDVQVQDLRGLKAYIEGGDTWTADDRREHEGPLAALADPGPAVREWATRVPG
jgi:hypothetical protein